MSFCTKVLEHPTQQLVEPDEVDVEPRWHTKSSTVEPDDIDVELGLPSDVNDCIIDMGDPPAYSLKQCSCLPAVPRPASIPVDSLGTGSGSVFSAGRNVHDATISFISLHPLTAAIKRPVWQFLYLIIAFFFLWTAARSLMRLKVLFPSVWADYTVECPATEVIAGVLMGEIGMAFLLAILLARLRYPAYGIKLIGISAIAAAWLSLAAVVVDGIVCQEPLRGALSFGIVVPQLLALGYAFLYDESKWHLILFFAGCANVLVGGINSYHFREPNYNVMGSGAIGLSYTVFSFAWHRFLLSKALRAMRPFKKQYDDLWIPIKEHQRAELVELAALVGRCTQKKQLQPFSDFNVLMKVAKDLHQWYQDVVAQWAEEVKAIHKPAPLKKRARVLEKIERSYKGHVQRVLDLVRATIVVTTVQEARYALELVLRQANVFIVKCRYDLECDGKQTNGYRDINLQLSFHELEGTQFEGFVFELQIILEEFFNIKSEGQHERYIECRNLQGN